MKRWSHPRCVGVLFSLGIIVNASAEKKAGESEGVKPSLNSVAATLDIKNSGNGGYPGGSTPIKGKWYVDSGSNRLSVAPEPLLDNWLEFGPEIREKGATIVVAGEAPGGGRLMSRFGAGLYGKNGFQLRVVPIRREVELVRRGEVLVRKSFDVTEDAPCVLELSVIGERSHWIISGRVWRTDAKRPEKALIEHKMFAEELLFPLAGRPVLFATPFSGEPVSFTEAKAYFGAYIPESEEAVEKSDREAE